jgi:hypothetical protein
MLESAFGYTSQGFKGDSPKRTGMANIDPSIVRTITKLIQKCDRFGRRLSPPQWVGMCHFIVPFIYSPLFSERIALLPK